MSIVNTTLNNTYTEKKNAFAHPNLPFLYWSKIYISTKKVYKY